MKTLFQIITGDDWSSIFRSVKSIYPYSWIYFYSFYITMVFIILNLFIGVVVNALQEAEEELNPSKGEDILNSIQEELKKIRNELTSIKESLKK
jgi:voltage-gated sodium channel